MNKEKDPQRKLTLKIKIKSVSNRCWITWKRTSLSNSLVELKELFKKKKSENTVLPKITKQPKQNKKLNLPSKVQSNLRSDFQ